ncbi:MAG: hypothetical protein FWB88_05250 [Defluviitaleaceae bacterium]|nr:hypothetical protein [Defluviitaleaceae bacterium]MCL2239804.1 hypothetical protein [Defluviitaleaceae bacterium]
MTQSERVILIQGDASQWYEQAIFIVKPSSPHVPVDMVAEAEKIIHNYMVKNKRPLPAGFPGKGKAKGYVPTYTPVAKKRGPSRAVDFFLNAMMILACLALAGVFLYGMVT